MIGCIFYFLFLFITDSLQTQVVKDRQNWMCKRPTRTLVFCEMADFNWNHESAAIDTMEEASIKRSDSNSSSMTDSSVTSEENLEQAMALGVIMDATDDAKPISKGKTQPENSNSKYLSKEKTQPENSNAKHLSKEKTQPENSKNKRTCFVCGRVVWIGSKDSAPRVIGPCLAYPINGH